VLAAIDAMGIEVPTPIQRLSIQPILDGRDVIAKAETGTGKTLAFGAPVMSRIDPGRASVLGLVLCPTRELAQQVAGVLAKIGSGRALRVALVVGGDPVHPQISALKAGAQIVVGTPGRVLDLYGQGFLSVPWTEFAVLDEADEMLEIGFLDDVAKILGYLPEERQTMLFSATFPPELLKLAREHTRNPVEVATALGVASVETIEHAWFKVTEEDMAIALTRLIEQSAEDDILLVFCNRRTEVDRLLRRLERMPFPIKALHGGYDQAARFRVMSAFRHGEVKALIATDVASRGLDVLHVTHVVNFGVPHDITEYTHRAGRTGRAGRSGHAVTLVTPGGMRRWKPLLNQMTWPIAETPLPERSRHGRSGGRDGQRGSERGNVGRRERWDERPSDERAPSPQPAEPARSGTTFGDGLVAERPAPLPRDAEDTKAGDFGAGL
jgi:ATP-dependent RNA helicase DeaD